ncbi:hypothetical protein OJ996_09020 [Luteolibacter sp. GHJ8]|uniref:YgdI/YgdR family lipoprotein n=1 Tax=Luteolibacter rhizosphaerae TaxID=2989719 RepID=A0ABT3G1K5_9BACT|nr:hypothetical protein [Luteolibacter rhizosphaerae]MCW1913714.1 hypothetical protein [Luteolibacter rhizosphaerae]
MKTLCSLTAVCVLALIVKLLTGCATTKTTRVLEDGTKVESSSYALTDRAAGAAAVAARYYFRVPSQSSGK